MNLFYYLSHFEGISDNFENYVWLWLKELTFLSKNHLKKVVTDSNQKDDS